MAKIIDMGSGIPIKLLMITFIVVIVYKIINIFKPDGKDVSLPDRPHQGYVDTRGSTITNEDAKLIADSFYTFMSGVGTDYSAIKSKWEQLNEGDQSKVFKAFGDKEYGTYGKPLWGTGTYMNLGQWFVKEFSLFDYSVMKKHTKTKYVIL